MSSRSRNYAASGDQFRGHVREVGERMTREWVWDETKEAHEARRRAHMEAEGRRWYSGPPRKGHYEDRGLQPYDTVRTYGPYSTIGPAKSAAGTGRDVRKVTTGKRSDGGHFTRTAEVHVGTVEWRLPE